MKKRKIFKKITLAGLAACMFCLPILAGCAPAEMLPEKPTQGQNFDLGLNPETDPVVFTTQSGLQIKKSDGKYSSSTSLFCYWNYGETATVSQNLTSFYYFTMGTFSGTIYTCIDRTTTYTVSNEPVNWLIIGRGPGFNFESGTPAGSAIQGEANKQEIAFSGSMYQSLDLSSIPEHSDIPKGCFLVLSEKLLGQMYFNSSGAINNGGGAAGDWHRISGSGWYGDRYRYKSDSSLGSNDSGKATWDNKTDGSLYSYINSLFSKNTSGTILENGLGFTQAQSDMIVPQQLYTFYSKGAGYPLAETPSTDGGTYYTMFPLARRAANSSTYQNFCIEDYFASGSQRIASLIGSSQAYHWNVRSGIATASGYPNVVLSNGNIGGWWGDNSLGVRPAMVMKLS